MRLYRQELIRILHTKRMRLAFAVSFLLSALLAVAGIMFSGANVIDENGSITELNGKEAVAYIEQMSASGNGEVTEERLREALMAYQGIEEKYNINPETDSVPLDIYWNEISPIRQRLRMISQAYGSAESPADIMELELSEIDDFYKACENRLKEVMAADDALNDEGFIRKALELYGRVERPFFISHGFSRDAMDYLELTILMLIVISSAASAPVFSERYASGEDSILRCCANGRRRLFISTLLAYCTVFGLMYFMGIGIHLLISDTVFGHEALKESVQVLYTVYSLPDMNLRGLQLVLAASGFVCCMAVTMASMCISAYTQEPASSTVLSLLLVFLPTLIYAGVGDVNWLIAIFPSAGTGLANNMLMSLVDLRFLRVGNMVWWYPTVLAATEAVEVPLFAVAAYIGYERHQV